jgi:hypothetical protein
MNKELNNSIFKNAVKGGQNKKQTDKIPELNSLVFYDGNDNCTLNDFLDAPSAYINFMSILVALFKQMVSAAKKIENACKDLLD